MKKIKVLHIISSEGIYGSENVILPWMKYTPNAVPSLLVFGPVGALKSPFAQAAAKQGVDTFVVSLKRANIFRTLKKSFGFADRVKPDVIHSHGYKGLFYGRLISWRYNAGLIHTNHGFVETTRKKRIYNFIELGISRCFPPEFVVAIAQNVKSRFLSFGVKRERLTVLTNAIPVDAAQNGISLSLPDDIASQSGGRRIVAFIGRLSHEKGPDLFIRAASEVLKKVSDVIFILAGDGPMKGELQKTVRESGISGFVLIPGYRSDVQKIMAGSDLIVMPSRTEATPLALLESMNLGKPIVASGVGDIPDIITHGIEGIIVPKEDIGALSNAISRVLSDDGLSKRIGAAAKKKVVQNFNISDRVGRLFGIYQEACRMKKHGSF
jgi:glycosyltransferase involved in cell wall biosynthesis